MTAILRLQLDDKDPVRVNSAINQLAEFVDRGGGGGRTLLTAARTYYVAPAGSDTNAGTSIGSPFLTIQHAYDVIANTIDTAGFAVTIQCASGTYTAGLNAAVPWTGGGAIILDIGGGTISSSGNCITVSCALPAVLLIQNGTLTSSGACCIANSGAGIIVVGAGMKFGSAAISHMQVGGAGAKIAFGSAYTITGGAGQHYQAFQAGNTIQGGGITVTITGTPAFSGAFAASSRLGCVDVEGATFSGSTTGLRYFADTNGVIFTAGGGANYFPGSSPGTPTPGVISPSGGIYV